MNVSEEKTNEQYVLSFRIIEDEINPKFSFGKLQHIIQNVCRSYSGEFSVKRLDIGCVYEDGVFEEAEDMIIRVQNVTRDEADAIAADLCAFLNLDEVAVSKSSYTYHTVRDDLK